MTKLQYFKSYAAEKSIAIGRIIEDTASLLIAIPFATIILPIIFFIKDVKKNK